MSKTLFDILPEGLKEYLDEQIGEGVELTTTHGEDSVVFILQPYNLRKWLVVIEWGWDAEDYSMVNITSDAWDVVYKKMTEENNRA